MFWAWFSEAVLFCSLNDKQEINKERGTLLLTYSLGIVCREVNTVFGHSRNIKGALSPNLFRNGRLVGQACFKPFTKRMAVAAVGTIILAYEGVKKTAEVAKDVVVAAYHKIKEKDETETEEQSSVSDDDLK